MLSRDEVWKILDAVRRPVYRVCLITIYSCGLRLMEGACLQVAHVDGGRKTHRNRVWLFPSTLQPRVPAGGDAAGHAISRDSLQKAFQRALQQSGVRKRAHVHTLRHSYATHLLEDRVQLQLIQEYLGHTNVRTTQIYTHLTREIRDAALDPIKRLVERV